MELMNVLSQIPLPVVVAVVTVLVIVTLVCVYQYTKMKGLDGIRGDVYQLILKAEHVYNASGQGEQKLKWVTAGEIAAAKVAAGDRVRRNAH